MSLQGPLLIVADKPADGLAQAFTGAGAFPVIEASWAEARAAVTEVKPSAVVVGQPDGADAKAAMALVRQIADIAPFVPMVARVRDGAASALPDALPIAEDAPVQRLIARLAAGVRPQA